MSTVALSMIVKDEFEQVEVLLSQAFDYFDQICVVVSDKTTCNKLKKNFPDAKFNIVWREWNNRFDEARNACLDLVTTDYFFWLDADDSFDFRAIPQLVDIADQHKIDAIFMPYNYMQDAQGNCITRHWRERLVRLGRGYSWRGWVHETCISDEKVTTHKVDFEVKHNATIDDAQHSYERNHAILEEAYAATEDPRYLHYLGMSYFTGKQYERAGELLTDYLQVGGSIEDVYRTLGLLSECAYHLGKFDLALEYATKCATLKPEYSKGDKLKEFHTRLSKLLSEFANYAKENILRPEHTDQIPPVCFQKICKRLTVHNKIDIGHRNTVPVHCTVGTVSGRLNPQTVSQSKFNSVQWIPSLILLHQILDGISLGSTLMLIFISCLTVSNPPYSCDLSF
jgi:glycosyltransferase involved in cell wall biosynthesis